MPSPSPPEPGSPWAGFPALLCPGLVLVLGSLYLDLIALGGPMGEAPRWVYDLAAPLGALHEACFGPLARDQWAVTGQQHRLVQTLACLGAMGAAYLAAVLVVHRRGAGLGQRALDLVLAVSVVCRILLVASPPLLESDPYRYLWDGAVQATGIDPYRHPPAAVLNRLLGRAGSCTGARDARELAALAELGADPRLTGVLARINHPDLTTCYPPAAEALFRLAHQLAPGSIQALKALVAALDLGVLLLLARLLARLGRPPGELLLYGWCPVLLKELAGSAHYDALASLAVLAAVLALLDGRRARAGAWLGLGIGAKLYPVALVVALGPRLGRRGILAAGLVVALSAFPYRQLEVGRLSGAAAFATGWVRNAPLFSAAATALERLPGGTAAAAGLTTRMGFGLLGLAGLVALARRGGGSAAELVGTAYRAVGLTFLLSPVANPWYLAWVLPLAVAAGSRAWPILGATMASHYAWYLGGGQRLPGAGLDLRVLEYAAFGLLLAGEAASGATPTEPGRGQGRPGLGTAVGVA